MEVSVPGSSSGGKPQYKRARSGPPAYKRKRRVQRKALSSRTHIFNRKFYHAEMVTNALAWQHWAMDFQLSYLPNFGEFTDLFDKYKINYVDVQFIYDHNAAEINSSAGTNSNANMGIPTLYFVRDYDDRAVLTSVDNYLEYEDCVVRRMDKPMTFRVYPRVSMAAYSGAWTSYTNSKAPWLDCNSPSVQHFGIKWGIDATMNNQASTTPVNIGKLTMILNYNLSFADVR